MTSRKLAGRTGRKPDVLRVIELSKVPMAVTVDDITDLCETVVKADDVLHVEAKQIGHSLKMTVCCKLVLVTSALVERKSHPYQFCRFSSAQSQLQVYFSKNIGILCLMGSHWKSSSEACPFQLCYDRA